MLFRNKSEIPKFETVNPSGELDFDAIDAKNKYLDNKTELINKKLESINKEVLVDIFLEIYKKSSGDQDEEKLFRYKRGMEAILGKVYTYLPESSRDDSVARAAGNWVEFNSETFENIKPLQLLRLFVHEACHTASIGSNKGVEISSKELFQPPSYTALNEAITEKMADYVVSEYVSRSGDKHLYEDFEKEMQSREGYNVEVYVLGDIIKEIALESGIQEDVVLRSIFGHYIRNDFYKVLETLSPEEASLFSRLEGEKAKVSDALKLALKALLLKVLKVS